MASPGNAKLLKNCQERGEILTRTSLQIVRGPSCAAWTSESHHLKQLEVSTSGYFEHCPGHVARHITREKNNYIGHFTRLTKSTQRNIS